MVAIVKCSYKVGCSASSYSKAPQVLEPGEDPVAVGSNPRLTHFDPGFVDTILVGFTDDRGGQTRITSDSPSTLTQPP